MNPYSYPRTEPYFSLHLKETNTRWLRYAVDFPIARPTPYKENNTAHGEYFRPHEGDDAPLAILIHGWGDRSIIPCRLLARALAKRGIACFILYLVFHSSRLPEVIKKRLPHLTDEEWFEGYQTSVIDVRQIIDWARRTEGINKEQIAVIGISLGGFVSAIAMGIDERIKAGVFLVTGGNSEKILHRSRISTFRKAYKRTEAEYNHIQNCYKQYLSEVAEKGFEEVTPPRQSFQSDPMTFAPYLRQRSVLMINALWDEFIPREATLEFWQACGKPAIAWFPATHATIWLWYPFISRRIADFLSSTFGLQQGSASYQIV